MVDLSDKVSDQASETEEMSGQTPSSERISSSSGGTNLKTCADCGTTKTPLWRGGPAGPKSLCNACGIRSRKKRRALLGLNKEDKKLNKSSSMKQNSNQSNNTSSSSSSSGSGNSISRFNETPIKRTFLGFGGNVPMQRPRSSSTSQRRRRRIGEVEQAAFLLMALSCGTVYA